MSETRRGFFGKMAGAIVAAKTVPRLEFAPASDRDIAPVVQGAVMSSAPVVPHSHMTVFGPYSTIQFMQTRLVTARDPMSGEPVAQVIKVAVNTPRARWERGE